MKKENGPGIKPRAYIGDVPVYCAYDDIIDIGKAIPNPQNPNQHPQSQIELLAKIIEAQGWRQPITISNRSGLIVKGHGRLLAAFNFKADQVPVEYQDYATEAEEIADLTADNRLAELSEMDNDTLTELLEELNDENFDIELAGYTAEDLEKLLSEMTTMDDDLGEEEEEEARLQSLARPGDIYRLGNHKLICGSETDPDSIKSLEHINAMIRLWEDRTGSTAVLMMDDREPLEAVGGETDEQEKHLS